jgi:hypothetical protein
MRRATGAAENQICVAMTFVGTREEVMSYLAGKALTAKRESKQIEFKQQFNTDSPREWCEVIKDVVAMANSGGGIIIFGLDNRGSPSGASISSPAQVDPADIGNKIAKYTGQTDLEIDILELEKEGQSLVAFLVHSSGIPVIFEKPGTYDIGGGRQHSAFSAGMVYFRHGAKSEPGTSDDIRRVIERQLEFIRKSWLKGIRKIVQAPKGSQIIAVAPNGATPSPPMLPSVVRAVSDPHATPVLLTRDPLKSQGTFVHEEVSTGIFDEINNVVDANRILSKGQQHFFLGNPVYFRIYAERQHVRQTDADILLLLRSAVVDLYAPHVYWLLCLPPQLSAKVFVDLYLYPKNPHVHFLMRLAILLGTDFSMWLFEKWNAKWGRHPQPPRFYWTFEDMIKRSASTDPVLLASRFSPTARISTDGNEEVLVKKLVNEPVQTAALLSKSCMHVFEGDTAMRSIARNLDFLAYGSKISTDLSALAHLIREAVGNRKPGDVTDIMEEA